MRSFLPWLCLSLLAASSVYAQDTGPRAGQTVAFMGDSITVGGWNHPAGYVRLVEQAMELSGRKIEPIPAGVSGNTSKDMLARLNKDVLSKKPAWMTLSCGVNDVWHGPTGCTLEEYEKNIGSILDQANAAGIKVVILTATMINEDPGNENNRKLVAYNDFLREQAKARKLPLADLNADMQAAVAKAKAANPNVNENFLTNDGVHMNGFGDQMMATGILKAFGLPDDSIAKAKAVWMDLPTAMNFQAKTLSINQYTQIRALAAQQGKTVNDFLDALLAKSVQDLLGQPAAASASVAHPAKL